MKHPMFRDTVRLHGLAGEARHRNLVVDKLGSKTAITRTQLFILRRYLEQRNSRCSANDRKLAYFLESSIFRQLVYSQYNELPLELNELLVYHYDLYERHALLIYIPIEFNTQGYDDMGNPGVSERSIVDQLMSGLFNRTQQPKFTVTGSLDQRVDQAVVSIERYLNS